MDYLHIGSTPYNEDCAQVGAGDYRERSRRELTAFQNQILRVHPIPKDVEHICSLGIKSGEVICYYNSDDRASLAYALSVEGSSELSDWDEQAKQELNPATAKPTKLVKGEFVFVDVLPPCDICIIEGNKILAAYDARTKMGPWGNVCEHHFGTDTFGNLGTGRGQKLFLRADKDKIVEQELVEA